jgi:hypothetical protein
MIAKHPRKPVPLAHLNELLDEALEETFPASDPIAVAVELVPSELEQSPDVKRSAEQTRAVHD